MEIIDISLTISPDLIVWPGDPAIDLRQVQFMDKGDACNVSFLGMGVHAGTHLDAPHHFLNDGQTVEKMDLEAMVGKAYVCQFSDDVDELTADLLENASIPNDISRLLVKTRNSKLWENEKRIFEKRFVAISPTGAEWIVKRGIKIVGVDYLSVAAFGEGAVTHRILLGAGIIALEGLNLNDVSQGFYELVCLPLKLLGSDGAPARVILRKYEL